jgi:hypothetical protein
MNHSASTAKADTPIIRGQTPASIIEASGLPLALAALTMQVVTQCRLWPSERRDVARELAGHFLDGLAAGSSEADLAAAFGDPRATARLITIARRRRRPLWWRAVHRTSIITLWCLLVATIIYSLIAARFYLPRPNIARNYAAEFNAPAMAASQSDLAWPLYIKARASFGKVAGLVAAEATLPGDERWHEMIDWLDSHSEGLALVRDAASKQLMGPVHSTDDPEFAKVMEVTSTNYHANPVAEQPAKNPSLWSVRMPHLGELRRNARWVALHSRVAAARGDRDAFVADIRAILGMASQANHNNLLIGDQVSFAIALLAFQRVLGDTHQAHLDDAHAIELASLLRSFGGGRIHIDPAHATLVVEDVLQRFYTDDGQGDGRLIRGEVGFLSSEPGVFGLSELIAFRFMQPIRRLGAPSRASIMQDVREFTAAAQQDDAVAPWERSSRRSDPLYLRMDRTYGAIPSLSVLANTPPASPMARLFALRDLVETYRDAALTLLAMQRYRLAKGAWPEALAQLVPEFLPSQPLDPFTGTPLKYLATGPDGLPKLYSIGSDLKDNGGVDPGTEIGRYVLSDFLRTTPGSSAPPEAKARFEEAIKVEGDLVFWPVPPKIKKP